MKILVAGSNKDGNDKEKERAIAILKEAGHDVSESCQLYKSQSDPKKGNDLVLENLVGSDIFYVVCSADGYTGNATAARLGAAEARPWINTYSSDQLADPDLAYYVEVVISPETLVEQLKLEVFR